MSAPRWWRKCSRSTSPGCGPASWRPASLLFMSEARPAAHHRAHRDRLGLMLLSLVHLGEAAEPLRNSASFKSFLSGLGGDPILVFLVGTLLTWLMHSSLSMVLLVMAFAGAHAIPDAAGARAGARRQCRRRYRADDRPCAVAARRTPRRRRQPADARDRGIAVPVPGAALRRIARFFRERSGAHGGQLPYRLQSAVARWCCFPSPASTASLRRACCLTSRSVRTSRNRNISMPTRSIRRRRLWPAPCARRSTWAIASPTC